MVTLCGIPPSTVWISSGLATPLSNEAGNAAASIPVTIGHMIASAPFSEPRACRKRSRSAAVRRSAGAADPTFISSIARNIRIRAASGRASARTIPTTARPAVRRDAAPGAAPRSVLPLVGANRGSARTCCITACARGPKSTARSLTSRLRDDLLRASSVRSP